MIVINIIMMMMMMMTVNFTRVTLITDDSVVYIMALSPVS